MTQVVPSKFSLESDYLIPEVHPGRGLAFHKVRLDLSEEQLGGSLSLDPNTCSLDEFGDPATCTRIAINSLDTQLKLIKEKDDERLYDVKAPKYDGPPLRLVTFGNRGQSLRGRLLLLKEDKTIDRIIELHRPAAAQPAS